MNCKHCNNERMSLVSTTRSNNMIYNEYYCCWCGSTVTEEKYTQRKSITKDYINMFNRKIKLNKAKIYTEFNRGLTSELFKNYIRAGYTKFGNKEDGYRIYDDQSKLIVEADTWTEALYQLYLYHMKNCNKENKINKNMQRSVISC